MKCPCENCLVMPLCRHKFYDELKECKHVRKYLYLGNFQKLNYHKVNIIYLEQILKPTTWSVGKETVAGFRINGF